MDKGYKTDKNKERINSESDENKPEAIICSEPSNETIPDTNTCYKGESNFDTKTGSENESDASKPVTLTRPNPVKVNTQENSDWYNGQTMIFMRSSQDVQEYSEQEETLFSSNKNMIYRTRSCTDLAARLKSTFTEYGVTQKQPKRKLVNDPKDTKSMSSKHCSRKENSNPSGKQKRNTDKRMSLEGIEQKQNSEMEMKVREESKENLPCKENLVKEKTRRAQRANHINLSVRQPNNMTTDSQREYCLYVVLEEKLNQNTHLKDFLKYRMGNPQHLDFTVKKTETINASATRHMVVLRFCSRRRLLDGRFLLNKSNRNSDTKVRCYDNENDAKGVCEDHKSDKLKVCEDIVGEAENVIGSHNKKLENEQAKLRDIQERLHAKKGLSLTDFQLLVDQKPALEDKIKELSLQRKEFVKYIQAMKSKIMEVIDKDFDKQVRKIRIAFGAECRRLEAALPMYACREEILTMVKENQVCVVLGETGSGKSTQMVQYLYQAGFAGYILILLSITDSFSFIKCQVHSNGRT